MGEWRFCSHIHAFTRSRRSKIPLKPTCHTLKNRFEITAVQPYVVITFALLDARQQ
jgi:hypothetical protein